MIEHFATFMGIAVLVIVTPGPDTALVIRNALLGGHRAGVVTSVGVVTGQAIWTLVASAGGIALLRASPSIFATIRVVGAAYLIFLGIQALRGTRRSGEPKIHTHGNGSTRGVVPFAFRQGVVNNLANPKSLLFFGGLLPQFVAPRGHPLVAFLLLGLTFSLLTLTWLAAYSIVLAKIGDVLRDDTPRRILEGLAGAGLVAFGIRMATERAGF